MTKNFIVSMLTAVGMVAGANALAAVPTGYFKGETIAIASNDKSEVEVFIRGVADGKDATTFALIVDSKRAKASVFRVEVLNNGLQAWTQLFQGGDRVLAEEPSGEPTYAGQLVGTGKEQEFSLVPTALGNRLGCNSELKFKKAEGAEWVASSVLNDNREYKGASNMTVRMGATSATGRFAISGRAVIGHYQVEHLFNGLLALRQQTVSATTADGYAIDREIVAFTAPIKRSTLFGHSQELILIRMIPEKYRCEMNYIVLKE